MSARCLPMTRGPGVQDPRGPTLLPTRAPTAMPLRLIQIVVPADREAVTVVHDATPVGRWPLAWPDGGEMLQFVVEADEVEPLIDRFNDRFDGQEGFSFALLAVEAALPAPDDGDADKEPDEAPDDTGGATRVSREELRADALDSSKLDGVYLAMVAASTVVAAVGVLRDDVAVIIGAMVIAPLLGPNVALALAATLADAGLAVRAIKVNLAGVGVALALSVAVGALVAVDPTVDAIASRTRPALSDLVLALAAGAAGSLAFTSGFPQAVIGVMVAVALLPPLVIFGLLVGEGLPSLASGALLLVCLNVICVNLAGVATFLARGVRPAGWLEAERAKASVRGAVLTWTVLLLLLAALLWIMRGQGLGPFSDALGELTG